MAGLGLKVSPPILHGQEGIWSDRYLSNSLFSSDRRHVALKLFILASSVEKGVDDEHNVHSRITEAAGRGHPGRILKY